VNGLELYLLGRRLMKLGVDAIPSSGFRELPVSVQSVLVDALGHPGSSISDITARTGFPQSHVSASVAKLRELGALVTELDPADRRRTLVQPEADVMQRASTRTSVPVDATIAAAIGADGEDGLAEVLAALNLLAQRLTPGVLDWPGRGVASAGTDAEEEGEG
jgi:DNA-binding MarR family transcriptional regulator